MSVYKGEYYGDQLEANFLRNKLIMFVHNGYPNETDYSNGIKKCYTPIVFDPAKIVNPSRSAEMTVRTLDGRLVKKDVSYTGIDKVEIEFYFSSITNYGVTPKTLINPAIGLTTFQQDAWYRTSKDFTNTTPNAANYKEGTKANYYVQLLQFAWYYAMPVYILEPFAWWSNANYSYIRDNKEIHDTYQLYRVDREEDPFFLAYRGVISEYPSDFFSNRKISGSPGRLGITVDGTIRATRTTTSDYNNTQDFVKTGLEFRTESPITTNILDVDGKTYCLLQYRELINYDIQDYNWQAQYLKTNNKGYFI